MGATEGPNEPPVALSLASASSTKDFIVHPLFGKIPF